MTSPATDSPPNATVAPPVAKTPAGALEIITAAMVAAVAVHLVVASAGGMFIFPWIAGMFAVEPKPKVVKKESVEVEMVDPVVAEPPPPEVPPTPPDQPPPPPESMPTPTEPQLLPPVINTPAEVPERNPVPPPRMVAVNPKTIAVPRTNSAPYIPSIAGSGPPSANPTPRVVQARFYQRGEPEYPYEARKRRIQGTVVLEAVFSADGKLVSLETKQSSGHQMLDKAAVSHGTQSFYSNTGQAERVLIPVEYRLIAR